MADDNQTQQTEQVQGNQSEARTSTGELKDQSPSTQQSGTDQKTNTEGSQNDRSFLNREPPKSEAKPEGDKPDGDKSSEDKAKPEPSSGAPEKYEDFKLPDGYTFDPEALKEVSGLFKEAGLSQEAAQKMVDYYAKNSLQAQQAPYDLWAQTQKDWVSEIDNRFGSKAQNMSTDINKGIDAVLTSPKLNRAFREAMDFTGMGSNPDFFEAMSMFVKPFLEGTSVPQGRVSPEGQRSPAAKAAPTLAEAMYPHLVGNRQQ